MKIAVTYENGQIFQHFGHTRQFKIYSVEGGKILTSEIIGTDGNGHGALAGILSDLKVNVLICGGIGGGAQMALAQAGIRWFGGVQGNVDKAVESFVSGALLYDPNARCAHHGHEDGEDHKSHNCGDHSCHESCTIQK